MTSDISFYDIFDPTKNSSFEVFDDVIAYDLGPPNQKSLLRLCAIPRKTFQSLSRGTRSFAFSRLTRQLFAMLPRFLQGLVRGAAARTKTALAILQF